MQTQRSATIPLFEPAFETENSGLSNEQQAFFKLFGYLKLSGLLREDISALSTAFDETFKTYQDSIVHWQHETHANLPRQIMPHIVEKSSEIDALSHDPRLGAIVSTLLGSDYKLVGSDANIFACGTRWHTDLIGLSYNSASVKIIFYFEAGKIGEDAFRVIPGSHHHTDVFHKKLKKNIRTPGDTLDLDMKDIPCQQIPTEPGDVIIFDPRLWHAVQFSGNTRRSVSFIFGDRDYEIAEASSDPDYR